MSKPNLHGATCTLIFVSILIIGLNAQWAKSVSTIAKETTIFTDSYYVASMHFNFSSIPLNGGTNVRVMFNASTTIDFYCQNSSDFEMSNSTLWLTVYSEWNSSTSFLNRTFVIPATDRWYFTFVNYENDTGAPPIDIYSVALYRIDTYEVHVTSDRQSYSLGEQASFTASISNDSNPVRGMSVLSQVFDPNGTLVSGQNNLTDVYGRVTISVLLPSEEGVFHCTAKTIIIGNPLEDSLTFVVVKNSTLPSTFDNYDGLWRTTDFTITLMAFDGESGVAETYYRIDNGPIQNVSTGGQPQISVESANNTLEYWSTDETRNEELPHNILTGIKLDKTRPAGSIFVSMNATYVNSTSVILELSGSDAISGVAQMRFSNDNMTWSDWGVFNSSSNWMLGSGDGPKTVYAQFMDNAGLVSDAYSANVTLDTTVPMIGNESRVPPNEVQPAQETKILVNVTDLGSGVKSVTLSYTINNNTWLDTQMSFNSTSDLYECIVPGQQASTRVEYRIFAYDNAGNEKIADNQGQYYTYTVVPEFPPLGAAFLFVIITLLVVAFRKKHRTREEN